MASPGTGSQSIDAGAVDITYIKNGRARTRRFPIIRTAGGELRAELEDRLEVRRAVVWITQAAGGTGSQAALSGIDFISDKRVRLPEPEPWLLQTEELHVFPIGREVSASRLFHVWQRELRT